MVQGAAEVRKLSPGVKIKPNIIDEVDFGEGLALMFHSQNGKDFMKNVNFTTNHTVSSSKHNKFSKVEIVKTFTSTNVRSTTKQRVKRNDRDKQDIAKKTTSKERLNSVGE